LVEGLRIAGSIVILLVCLLTVGVFGLLIALKIEQKRVQRMLRKRWEEE